MKTLLRVRIDYRALADFRYEMRRFLIFSEQAARAAGIEPQQHQALLVLKGIPASGKVTVGALAEQLQIKHHSAVELIDRMEAQGLVRRQRSGKDRREVLLRPTPRGEKLLLALSLPHQAELRSAGPTLLRALTAAISHVNHPGRRRALEKHGSAPGRNGWRRARRKKVLAR